MDVIFHNRIRLPIIIIIRMGDVVMKKIFALMTVAALVGISSSCFAGPFGGVKLPGNLSITNNKTEDSKLEKTSEAVDLNGMMARQKQMTQYMIACNNLAVDGWVELNNSTGNDVTGLLTAKKAQNANTESEDDALACSDAITNTANDKIDEAKVKANTEAVKAAIAKAKELKVQAENERTKAAIMLPAATAEIGDAAKIALRDFSFAKQFKPVKKVFDVNKKLLSASDKNLKAMNARIAKLEKLISK